MLMEITCMTLWLSLNANVNNYSTVSISIVKKITLHAIAKLHTCQRTKTMHFTRICKINSENYAVNNWFMQKLVRK